MTTRNRPKRLTDEELDELADVLARVKGGAISNVETLDGFLTAIVVCPELIGPSEYMNVITGGATEDDDLVFESDAEAERILGLMMRHWNVIADTLHRGKIYLPVMVHDESGVAHGNDWANGFLMGTRLRFSTWEKVACSEERGGPFIPIWALAYEHASDPSLRPYREPVSPERRKQLLAGMVAGVKRLYDGFAADRKRWAGRAAAAGLDTFRGSAPKVGRNDPCPCGSGKKFKKCCGLLTIH